MPSPSLRAGPGTHVLARLPSWPAHRSDPPLATGALGLGLGGQERAGRRPRRGTQERRGERPRAPVATEYKASCTWLSVGMSWV
eukprot:scaffold321472_cov32-Tisochrysis_lutea.AAC.1